MKSPWASFDRQKWKRHPGRLAVLKKRQDAASTFKEAIMTDELDAAFLFVEARQFLLRRSCRALTALSVTMTPSRITRLPLRVGGDVPGSWVTITDGHRGR